ncbi:hypothetical protein E8F11_13820 [Pseudomonas sp. BN417]|uniref:hypothetical protein n=1 Tax=Pseudomonas sp. BN417 TaxID=2567890 RepID=UPI0024552B76|nr:hypothetical protein [Pseudomonas sp. BN417]MDH4556234.1 hypothetical protein [Pseudomonas sp. BN417]
MKLTTALWTALAAAGVVALAASIEHDPRSANHFEIFGTLRSGRQAILQALHTFIQGLGVAR